MNDSDAEDLLRLAMEAQREFSGYGARAAYARLEEHYGELGTALSWFFEHERLDESLQLTLATVEFWQATSRIGEGRKLLDRALSFRRTEDALRAEALFQAGMLAFWQGDDEVARQLHEQSLEPARALADATQVALALTGIARIELRTDIDRARALSQQALDEVGSLDEVRGRSNAFHLQGVAAQMSEHERAIILLSVADRLMGEQGTAWPPDEAPHFEHAKNAASEALGPETTNVCGRADRR
jgi:tetratricopeptide (TPR) repeat protein